MGKKEFLREKPPVQRRDFLKMGVGGFALTAGALSLVEILGDITNPVHGKAALAKGVVLVDAELCSGCRTCEAVCTTHNDQGKTSSSLARISVEKDHTIGHYQAKSCWQCEEPLCMLACPVAALEVDKTSGTNARIIDARSCLGCGQCIRACSSSFCPPRPKYDRSRRISVKCHLCLGKPLCVEFCPCGALRYEHSDTGLRTGYPTVREK